MLLRELPLVGDVQEGAQSGARELMTPARLGRVGMCPFSDTRQEASADSAQHSPKSGSRAAS